jgi:hypothetical protein
MSNELVPCKHIFSNGTEFEFFIETQCEKCKRFRNGKSKIYNACWEARYDEKKFPFKYLLEYECYAGKRCKMFTDKPIERKRREHIIEGQESLFKE